MGRVELFTENLTMRETLEPILKTHLGQAHFAGTGPAGKTCRECAKWFPVDEEGNRREFKYAGHNTGWLELCPARCNHPIMNKADRNDPHDAEACRLFAPADAPPVHGRADKRRKDS